MTRLLEPDAGTGELDEGEETPGVFIEAREDAPEVLEFADEARDEVPLRVGRIVTVAWCHPAFLGGDRGRGMQLLLDISNRRVSIIPAIGQDFLRPLPGQQREGLRVVARRPTRQDEFQGITQRIDQDVNLGAEATA